jgi:3-hydroxyacyl-[acyl-carrier-protein] dehydratase
MNIDAIMQALPHRYPFLMIDRVLTIVPNERLIAIKNVTINEPFFQGHFPSEPIMPGVLLIEMMAQALGLLLVASLGVRTEQTYLTGVDRVRFKKKVIPGDQLHVTVSDFKFRQPMVRAAIVIHVAQDLIVSADIMCYVQ